MKQWIKAEKQKEIDKVEQDSYLTFQSTSDGGSVAIYSNCGQGVNGVGTFEVSYNGGDWKIVDWDKDVGVERTYSLLEKVGIESMKAGDTLAIRNLDAWCGNMGNEPVFNQTSCRVFGNIGKSLTTEFAKNCNLSEMFGNHNGSGIGDARNLVFEDVKFPLIGTFTSMFARCTMTGPVMNIRNEISWEAMTFGYQMYPGPMFYESNMLDLHYPKAVLEMDFFKNGVQGAPMFGATTANIHYDL